jgi:tetratricopeptide (TPR) repeat protein
MGRDVSLSGTGVSPGDSIGASDLSRSLASARERLRRGQACESRGEFTAALALYDEAIAALSVLPPADLETRCLHGVAWMNRGNALQKCHLLSDTSPSLHLAVAAYDEAIALLRTLPFETQPVFRNHLGAAWLNRGHALLAGTDTAEAITSFECAATHFEQLPLGDDISYRLNLAGARTNLAHVLLATEPVRARTFAQTALALLDRHERTHSAFAEMSLRARRALAMAIGGLLQSGTDSLPAGISDHGQDARATLLAEATDAIDDGLALARGCIARGATPLRPLALRLFRLGAQLYGNYQPQFLAEFVFENLADGAFAGDPDFRAAAQEALSLALTELQKPQRLTIGDAAAAQVLATAHSLRVALQKVGRRVPAEP